MSEQQAWQSYLDELAHDGVALDDTEYRDAFMAGSRSARARDAVVERPDEDALVEALWPHFSYAKPEAAREAVRRVLRAMPARLPESPLPPRRDEVERIARVLAAHMRGFEARREGEAPDVFRALREIAEDIIDAPPPVVPTEDEPV